jgi:hypothetical protein
MNYAQICNESHTVLNIVVWDGVTPYQPEGCSLVEIPADTVVDIGYSYVDGVFSPPAP